MLDFLAVLEQYRNPVLGNFDVSDNSSDDTLLEGDADTLDGDIRMQKFDRIDYKHVENNSIVELSHVESHDIVYVRPTNSDAEFITLMRAINKKATHPEISPTVPLHTGDVILMHYAGDYCRAFVETETDHELKIRLMDYGKSVIIEKCKVDASLRYISPEYTVANRLAIPVMLALPAMLEEEEKSAVVGILKKYTHMRYYIKSKDAIGPYSIVELMHIGNAKSLTDQCREIIQKRWKIEDIDSKKIAERRNVNMCIVDNENLSKGFICCVLADDVQLFAQKSKALTDFGKTLENLSPHIPNKLELCLTLYPDEDGTDVWYRAQYQIELTDERAQVGLIDFGVSAVVKMSNIRKFHEHFAYERISFTGKIRGPNTSLELLNQNLFENYANVTADRLRAVGEYYEFYFGNAYFFEDDNYEEDILLAEDLQN